MVLKVQLLKIKLQIEEGCCFLSSKFDSCRVKNLQLSENVLTLSENRGFLDMHLTMHGSHVIEEAWLKLWNLSQVLMGYLLVPKPWL